MTYVDDAFANCKSALEITKTEKEFASRKQNDIRAVVSEHWDVDEDFLTGSYRRETKTKKLKDVDIFIVIDPDGEQAGLHDENPTKLLSELQKVLENKYDDVTPDGFGCTVRFGQDDEVASFDVVPAFSRSSGGWEIPDADRGRWISTNPKEHHVQSTAKNGTCDGMFVPLVKMIKGVNREMDEPISPSFLLEVMAHSIFSGPMLRYPEELQLFFATAAERIHEDWPDPAGIGPDVNSGMTPAERTLAASSLSDWQRIAERALRLEQSGSDRQAVEVWRELFGYRMPRP